MKIPLILEKLDNGCVVPTSHKLNADGYFRKWINGVCIMYHRYVWEEENGVIPTNHEIDHTCKTRHCCNIDHLQMLTSSEHRRKDNMERAGNFTGVPMSYRYV